MKVKKIVQNSIAFKLFSTKWYRALLIVGILSFCTAYIPGLEKIKWWSSINESNSLSSSTAELTVTTVKSTFATLSLNWHTLLNNNNSPLWTTISEKELSCNNPYPIEDPSNNLSNFFEKLIETSKKKRITRIVHYGDSLIAGDWVTSTLRDSFQREFGDAGPGFILPMKAWRWYGHKGLKLEAPNGWKVYRITRPPIYDNRYGLGGVTFVNRRRFVSFVIKRKYNLPPFPKNTIIQIFAEASPKGGYFSLYLDKKLEAEFSTISETKGTTFFVWNSSIPFRKLKIKVIKGRIRLYGIVFEYGKSGIVYDSLGILGAQFTHFLKMPSSHWLEQLKMRAPDLIIFHYGTNESESKKFDKEKYYHDIKEILSMLKKNLPESSCLVLSPMDRAMRVSGGRFITMPIIKKIVETQRKATLEVGCAFWNTFMAMGGEGAMARWGKMKPRLASTDYTHPTSRGAKKIAKMLFCSLIKAYHNYKNSKNSSDNK